MNKNHVKFLFDFNQGSGRVRQEDMEKCLSGECENIRVIHKGFSTRKRWNAIKDSKGIQDAIAKFYPEYLI